jgi:hypothetical protein
MKSRFGIIGTIMLLFTVIFTGCADLDLDELTQFSIVSFEIQPQLIHNGESANLSWIVTGAQTAYIDHGVGNVSNIGKRIVFPTENTTYMLTASNETKTRKATVQIIVLQNFETETNNNIVPTVQMLADEDDDRLSVINVYPDVYWDELAIRVTETVVININGEVSQSEGTGLFADTYYQISDNMMSSGDAHVLVHGSDFIDIEAPYSLTHVTITIIHDVTDTTLGTYTFASIIGQDWIVPTVQMLADEDDDRLVVINVDDNVYWDELAIRVTGNVKICINGEVTGPKGYNLTTDTYYKISDYVMSSGSAHVSIHGSDFIDLEGTSASLSDVTVTIIHDVTDTTLGTYTYSSIAQLA